MHNESFTMENNKPVRCRVCMFPSWEMVIFRIIEYHPIVNVVLPLIISVARCILSGSICRYNRKCRICQNFFETSTVIVFGLVSVT